MKKKLVVLAMVGILMAVFTVGNAMAAAQWYTCTISQAGSTIFGYSFITVTDTAQTPAFTNAIFFISDTAPDAKNMYASALTALANSSNVWVFLDAVVTGAPVMGCAALK
jgi:hypothetical protein